MQELADIRVGRKFAFTLLNGEQVFCYVQADDSGYYIAHDHLPPVFLFDVADIDAPVFQQRVLGYRFFTSVQNGNLVLAKLDGEGETVS
jgi:hypothetical protein